MVELVKFIARSLVEKPDSVDVREVIEAEKITIELRVPADDPRTFNVTATPAVKPKPAPRR